MKKGDTMAKMYFESIAKHYGVDIKKPIKVAIMGCVVNGPGEAKEADIGIAGGGTGEKAVVFKKGEKLATGKLEEMIQLLIKEIHNL